MAGLSSSFPMQHGIFDAHCHPTDTIHSLGKLPGMRANVLTIMATRAEDQILVVEAAREFGLTRQDLEGEAVDWSHVGPFGTDCKRRTLHKIVPAFGWHPWFSFLMFDEDAYNGTGSLSPEQKIAHYRSVLTPVPDRDDFIKTLPDPQPFGKFLEEISKHLSQFPLALIGEVGIDKSCRMPMPWTPEQMETRSSKITPGSREGRQLSPYKISIEHQKFILSAQLRLAGVEQRAVSVHGVAAHGILYDTLDALWEGQERQKISKRKLKKKIDANDQPPNEKPHVSEGEGSLCPSPTYPPRICLHSYSGPAETVRRYTATTVPCEVYFSFSVTINSWSQADNGKVETAVRAVPDDRLLMESDMDAAGDRMDNCLEEIARKLCFLKGWHLDDGMRRLRRNWERFILGPA